MERLKQLIEWLDNTPIDDEAVEPKRNEIVGYLCELAALKQAESEGRIAPCSVGDTVYIITKCEKIPTVLDGTLYDSNGGPGTATGYYCPYEDNCPHDAQDCKPVKGRFAIFEDVVERVIFDEDGTTVYSKYCCCNTLWENAFLYRVEAEAALAAMEGEDNGIR